MIQRSFFDNRLEANKALKDEDFAANDIVTFIPGNTKVRKGVEEIKKSIKSEIQVDTIIRMNRRNKDSTSENDRWIPTTFVLVSFKEDTAQRSVSLSSESEG